MSRLLRPLFRRLFPRPLPFVNLHLCTACQSVFDGAPHRTCLSPDGPHLVHLASYLAWHRARLLDLTAELARATEAAEAAARPPAPRAPAQRLDHVGALTDFRQPLTGLGVNRRRANGRGPGHA